MRLLAASTASTAAVATGLYFYESASDDPLNVVITVFVSITLLLGCTIMLLARLPWKLRSIGIFWSTLASGVFYGYLAYTRISDTRLAPGTSEFILDTFVKSPFIIGAPAFLVGIIAWAYGHFADQPDAIYDGPDRRTGPPDRRGWAEDISANWERTD